MLSFCVVIAGFLRFGNEGAWIIRIDVFVYFQSILLNSEICKYLLQFEFLIVVTVISASFGSSGWSNSSEGLLVVALQRFAAHDAITFGGGVHRRHPWAQHLRRLHMIIMCSFQTLTRFRKFNFFCIYRNWTYPTWPKMKLNCPSSFLLDHRRIQRIAFSLVMLYHFYLLII